MITDVAAHAILDVSTSIFGKLANFLMRPIIHHTFGIHKTTGQEPCGEQDRVRQSQERGRSAEIHPFPFCFKG